MNSNNKYYFSKEDKKNVINVLDNRKYEISELEELDLWEVKIISFWILTYIENNV